jgi:hypothetical protein
VPDSTHHSGLERAVRALPRAWSALSLTLALCAAFGGCGKSSDTGETAAAGGGSGTAGSTAQVNEAGAGQGANATGGSAQGETGGTGTGGAAPDETGGTGTGGAASTDAAGAGTTSAGGDSVAGAGGDSVAGAGGDSVAGAGGAGAAPAVTLPPANAQFDYQLGGAYEPPEGVLVVSRDRNDPPAAGLYNICYVNGFQTQPDEENWWLSEHPDLLLRDNAGDPVVDEDWGEMLLDVSTPEKREALAAIVGEWIAQCAADGFDAIEIDNLDSYSRSDGLLEASQAVRFMGTLSAVAHEHGLASGQKNSVELLGGAPDLGTDFAVAEECNRWDECADYETVYGNRVFVIEYRDRDFAAGCADFPELSIVRRDLDVSTPSSPQYVYDAC